MKHLKSLFVISLLMCSNIARAYDFEVNGICYNYISITSAAVAPPSDFGSYSGVVTIPETVVYVFDTYNVTTIGSGAFTSCSALTGVVMPNSITSIESDAFIGCNALADITIPEQVKTIGDRAFANCSALTSIVIPGNVETVGGYAFAGCSKLADIVVERNTPPTIQSTTFSNFKATLTVPYGTKALYETAVGWKNFTNIVEMESDGSKETVTEVTITVNEYGCATYCSEHALDFANVAGLKAYSAIGFNSSTQVVTLARVMATAAQTGMLIKGEPGSYTVPVIEECNDHTLNLLVGTLENITLNSTTDSYSNYKFTIIEGDDTPKFYPFIDNTTFGSGKAYLQIPTAWLPASARSTVNIRFDEGETTGVDAAEMDNVNAETVYDIGGHKVVNPARGIYIVNGQKVLIDNVNK